MTVTPFFNFKRAEWLIILAVALGYFVDAYDLIVFSAVRISSLRALGVNENELLNYGLSLLNWQLFGLVIGGLFWGILADKFGRTTILFGSIITYSLANLANGWVNSVDWYLYLRIIAGIGLAGELGVGISLVSESLPKEKRTYATTIVSVFGMMGAFSGGLISLFFAWKTCYFIGGVAGLFLLLLRFNVYESGIFLEEKEKNAARGNVLFILKTPKLLATYFFCTLAGGTTFILIGLFIQNVPEFATAFGLTGAKAALAIIFFYFGGAPAEICAGLISKKMKSRKKPMYIFFLVALFGMYVFCFVKPASIEQLYLHCAILGLGIGYWTILITTAAEQFSTHIRATAATSIPNFARAWSIPFTLLFKDFLKPSLGLLYGAFSVGALTIVLAIISVSFLKETFENEAA